MAVWKCTALWKASTNNVKGGSWSEQYFTNASSLNSAQISFTELMTRRSLLLATGFGLTGFRFSNLSSPGQSITVQQPIILNGSFGAGDTPWQSLILALRTTEGNKRELLLPGVPDAMIVNGAFVPSFSYAGVVNAFVTGLINGGWGIYGVDFTNPRVDVLAVNGDGTYVFGDATTAGPGDAIKFFRTKDTLGKSVKGIFRIESVATPNTGKIRFWKTDRVVEKGKVNKYSRSLKLFTAATTGGITKRALGKDFFQFVGRRKKAS